MMWMHKTNGTTQKNQYAPVGRLTNMLIFSYSKSPVCVMFMQSVTDSCLLCALPVVGQATNIL
jgi:hypothetical protein